MKTIALCASVTFYKDVIYIKNELKKLGFNVEVPMLAEKMERENNFDTEGQKREFLKGDRAGKKAVAIRDHFRRIGMSDAVLVVNNTKNGKEGYIGGNVLIEMGVAFFLGKKIFVLNSYEENTSIIDEIEGIGSIVLNGDINKIKL